jgi:hypothetical protein
MMGDMSTTPAEPSAVRVGDAERQAAIAQLRGQWQAGRLDPTEHEARTTRAYAAVTRGDLDALFTDLPALPPGNDPHDAVPSTSGTPGTLMSSGAPGTPMPSTVPGTPMPPSGGVSSGQGGLIPPGSWVHGRRNAIMSLTPFVALGLFLLTRQWYFFLLVPALGALFYAGDDGSKSARRRDRDERRRRDRGE